MDRRRGDGSCDRFAPDAPNSYERTLLAVTVGCALGLAIVPLVTGRLVNQTGASTHLAVSWWRRISRVRPRPPLPEVDEVALKYRKARGEALVFEQAVYLVLGGLLIFYGIGGVLVAQGTGGETESSPLTFWTHVGAFAVYSDLIAYFVFHQEVPDLRNLLFYAAAMIVHFAVTDYGLRRHHDQLYERLGRWVLSGATLLGAVVGYALTLSVVVTSLLFGFVAGSLVLNVIEEELPDAREGHFVPFAAGTFVYVALVVLT